jgi:hypothetical protein
MPALQSNKQKVMDNIPIILEKLNEVLNGQHLEIIEPVLSRIDRTGHLPHWYHTLQSDGRLPNLDGKTVGSVIEKLLVCVLEIFVFESELQLSVNPARGVDIPELELGVKSPSTNYCTSEPYFSAYERLLGNEYDAIILLTNYQEAKNRTPFSLQILQIKYLEGTEIADAKLCRLAKNIRDKYPDELFQKKAIRFLSYVNQSDWEANCILKLFDSLLIKEADENRTINAIHNEFNRKNRQYLEQGKTLIPEDSLDRLLAIRNITPIEQGVIIAADNWVILTQKDSGRFPNDNEWHRFQTSPLNGKIGMSFALQWRYNFGGLFHAEEVTEK